jgi:hypothetical protein
MSEKYMKIDKSFESLRIENKHLLPEPWYQYPVLKAPNFESIQLLKKSTPWKGSTIRVGIQDGVYVLGFSFLTGSCNPGRKWGEFKTRQDAITYFVKKNLPEIEKLKGKALGAYSFTPAEINEIIETMYSLLTPQLELF